MATKYARLQVVLKPETYAAIKQAAQAVGGSMSGLCSELLDSAVPTLIELQAAVKLSKIEPARAFAQMAEVLARTQAEADQLQLELDKDRGPRKAQVSKK